MSSFRIRNADRVRGNIVRVGNDDAPWSHPTWVVADWIVRGVHDFFVSEDAQRAVVRAIPNGDGTYHLRTDADRTSRNNLDNLPPIRVAARA